MSSTESLVFLVLYGGLVTLAVGVALAVVTLVWVAVTSLVDSVRQRYGDSSR